MKKWIPLYLLPVLTHATLVIGISGASGSGKTTLTKKLKEALGDKATVLSQDSYYNDLTHLTLEERRKLNFDCPSSIDFDLLKKHINALKEQKNVEQPIYSFVTSTRTGEHATVKPSQVLLVEGSLLYTVPEIREILDIKLFIDLDMDICLYRRIERDQIERGRKFKDITAQYFATVRPMYLKHIAPSITHADIIIPNENENEMVLKFISEKLLDGFSCR